MMELCANRTAPAVIFAFWATAALGQTISGTVTESQNGPVLGSMVVAAYTTAGVLQANTTTNASGHYDLTLPPGLYRVLAYDPGGTYATTFGNDAPSFEESPLIPLATGQTVTANFALRRGVTVTGSVATTGGSRAGVIVAAYNLSGTRRGFTTTNATGNYSLVLPPGNYKFAAYDDAGAFSPAFFRGRTNFFDADVVTVQSGRSLPSIDFLLTLGARASGIVTDAAGIPLGNISLLAYTADGRYLGLVSTGADGRFTMTLPRGSYRFVAIDTSFTYAAAFLDGATSFEASPVVNLIEGQSKSDLMFRLERGGLIAGTVVDAGGAGIAGITVAAYNIDGTMRTFVTTDASGKYVLLLPPGAFRIGAFDPALVYATQFYPKQIAFIASLSIASTIGQTSALQPFVLSRGGRVSGTVIDRNTGAVIGGALIQAYDSSAMLVASATTGADGRYRMVLPAGAYRLIAADAQVRYAPGYTGGATSFDTSAFIPIIVDAETTADFALSRGTLVIGSVMDESLRPIGGVEVAALDANQNRVATATTSDDGRFRMALVPGSYKFMASDAAGRYLPAYAGGTTFATAASVPIDATGAPGVTILMRGSLRHRSARH